MRPVAVLLMVVLAACGGTAPGSPSPEPPEVASVEPEAPADATPSAPVPPAARLTARPLDSGDNAAPLGYLEYLPPSYGGGAPLSPLLIFLHGGGEAGDGSGETLDRVRKLGIPRMIADGDWPADQPFVVLAPQYGTAPASDRCDIADDIARFLDFALLSYEVDPARVYLTGISCGAIGIWDYIGANGDDIVAAAVPIAGHAEWAIEEATCGQLASVPIWAFHGALDEVVPVVHIRGPMDEVTDCFRPNPSDWKLTVYPDADHDSWSRTYDLSGVHDIYAWMLERTND